MKQIFIFLTFCLVLNGCATSAMSSKQVFQIKIANKKYSLNNFDSKSHSLISEKSLILAQSFMQVGSEYHDKFILDRKNIFLNLFKDDIDPYTGFNDFKSKCLINQNEQSVYFYSGSKSFLANCLFEPNNIKEDQISIRLWKKCHNTIWELTLFKSDYVNTSFVCY